MESAKKSLNDPSPSANQVENIAEDGFEKSDPAFEAATKGQVTTGYEELGAFETIKTFKLCTLVCFAMAFSAATDGYQIGYVKIWSYISQASLTTCIFLESMPVLLPTPALFHALPPLSARTENLHLHRLFSVAGVRLCPVARSWA